MQPTRNIRFNYSQHSAKHWSSRQIEFKIQNTHYHSTPHGFPPLLPQCNEKRGNCGWLGGYIQIKELKGMK